MSVDNAFFIGKFCVDYKLKKIYCYCVHVYCTVFIFYIHPHGRTNPAGKVVNLVDAFLMHFRKKRFLEFNFPRNKEE